MRICFNALSTIASGVGLPCFASSSFSSEPALTPMRIGVWRSRAARTPLSSLPARPDIARIEAQAVHPLLERLERQPVVEVDVSNEGDADLGANRAPDGRGLPTGAGEPHHLTARRLQGPDLIDGGLDVAGIGLGHGLDRDRRVPADLERAHLDLPRLPPCFP